MELIEKIKLEENGESYAISATELKAGYVADFDSYKTNVAADYAQFGNDEIGDYMNYFHLAADNITMYAKNGVDFQGYMGEDITIKVNGETLATQNWVQENASGGNTFESIQVGNYTSISEGKIQASDAPLQIVADGLTLQQFASPQDTYIRLECYDGDIGAYPITIQAKDAPIKLYGKELLFNDQPVGGGSSSGNTFESISLGDSAPLQMDEDSMGRDGNFTVSCQDGFDIQVYEDEYATINNKPIATREWVLENAGGGSTGSNVESLTIGSGAPISINESVGSNGGIFRDSTFDIETTGDITINASEYYPIKLYGKELLFNDQPVIGGGSGGESGGVASSLTAGESNEYYAQVHVGTDYVRFGDDENFGYIDSFYVAADDITIYSGVGGVNFRNYQVQDFTINVNDKPLATQEWVLANAGFSNDSGDIAIKANDYSYINIGYGIDIRTNASVDIHATDGPLYLYGSDGVQIKSGYDGNHPLNITGSAVNLNNKELATKEWVTSQIQAALNNN